MKHKKADEVCLVEWLQTRGEEEVVNLAERSSGQATWSRRPYFRYPLLSLWGVILRLQ